MMGKKEKSVLREYVRCVLSEDGGGGGGDGGFAGDGFGFGGTGGGMGGGMSIGDDLIYKTFVKGWVDLFKTATSATKSMVGSARLVIKVAFDFVVDAVIPFYKARYQEHFENHRELQNQIRQEHAATYQSITQALASNDDFLVSAFMYDPSRFFDTTLSNPSAFVTAFSALNAPDAIGNTLEILSGGMFGEIMQKVYSSRGARDKGGNRSDWDSIVNKMKGVLGNTTIEKIFGQTSMPEARLYRGQRIIVEEEKRDVRAKKPEKKGKEMSEEAMEVMRLMLNPQILQMVMQSKKVQEMMHDQREATDQTLGALVKDVQTIMKVSSIEDLETLTGKNFEVPNGAEIPAKAEQMIIQETQQSVKVMYSKMLKAELSHLLKTVPKENGLAQAYIKALKAIEQV